MICVYCSSSGPFTDEHVLARAFAGPGEDWMLVGLVCGKCNKLFSTYERAWTAAPGEGTARIYWGPSGRERKGRAYQVHPSEHVFLISPQDSIAYEVDILRGIEPRLRPRLVLSSAGISVRASAMEDLARFKRALDAFLPNREITIQKRRRPGKDRYRIAILSDADTFAVKRIEWRSKPVQAWLDRFPEGLLVSPDPRVSVDAHGRLRIRARSVKQATSLMSAILAQGHVTSAGGTFQAGTYSVALRSVYDVGKIHRAVAKTLINYAVDMFGPAWIAEPSFRPVLDFCLGRIGDPPGAPFVGVLDRLTGIRAIDDAPPERHVLALCCNRKRVVGLLRLYGGSVYRLHIGPAPAGTEPFTKAVWIDFNGPGRVPLFT
jgi:hypothetical protein